MTRSEDTKRDDAVPRERSSALIDAVLRINASLDLDTVLREVVESARALTGARYGVIVVLDEAGATVDFVSSGFTAEEWQDLVAWPGNAPLFEHLRNQPGPLRIADVSAFVGALGIAPATGVSFSRALQGTPMRHRGVDVGHFFLAEKADGKAFTGEDEEALMLFASQAATAIANARTHRNEQQARADLEALIETSPVGVVVFDAKSGRPVSFNRESRRIVEGLRMPGRQLEELLEVISFSRADGREISLGEFPLAQYLCTGETVRAEEVVLSVPDGRSVRTLINATPIPGEDGAVASVVVTMQDLAPLDEIERMRSEFLSLVGHELRTPLAAIMGSVGTALDDSQTLDPAELREFLRVIDEQAKHMRGLIGDLLDAGRIDAGTLSVSPEPTDVGDLVERARNTYQGGGGRHGIAVDLPAGLPPVMADGRRIVQVLNNLFANAARHAPESAPIRVAALREEAHVAVSVRRGSRDRARAAAASVHQARRRRRGRNGDRPRPGPCDLQGAGGGAWRAHPGREPRPRPRHDGHLHAAGGRRARHAEAAAPPPIRPDEKARILAVDDDPRMLRLVRDALAAAGYAPLVTGEPGELAAIIRAERPRLVLLDLILPGQDGIELMAELPELSDIPVIFISAYGRDETVARALEAGAADYIVKPFSPTELVARVRAALRRHEEPEPFVLGELAIDYERRRVTAGGTAVDLTATEYELLRVLSLEAGRVVTYDTLLRRVWGGRNHTESNPLRAFVRSLRRKLGDDAADPTWIFNQRGVGYRMPRPGEE